MDYNISMKLMIIWGSSRHGRKGGVVSDWVKSAADKNERFSNVDFVDLRELNLPFYNEPTDAFSIEKPEDYSTPEAIDWAKRVMKADGIVLVTPEYNHGPPAVLKNALDYIGRPWFDKPVGLISYGGVTGGARAVEQLRSITIELGLINVANAIHLVRFRQAFESGKEPSEFSNDKLKKMFDEILRLHKAFQK